MSKGNVKDVAKIEEAIRQKYGIEATVDPNKLWDTEKEKSFLEQLRNLNQQEPEETKEENEGYSVIKKLIKDKQDNVCPKCKRYGLKKCDDVYLSKYGFCEQCYIRYYEGSLEWWEERNKKGKS